MPLHEESSILSAFRNLFFSPKSSVDRGTKGVPESSQSFADKFLSKLKIKSENPAKIVSKHWNNCMPARFVGRASPLYVRTNILYVEVENASVRQEMMFSEREILKKVQKIEGCSTIKKIRFV